MPEKDSMRAEIEQLLRSHPRSHFAKRFHGMELGWSNEQMTEEAVRTGEGVRLERIAYVRETVRMTLEGELANGTARAKSQAALYRELLNYQMSPELRQHVTTRLTQLQQIEPTISLEPLGDIRLGANSRSKPKASPPRCDQCFQEHVGECL